MSKVIIKIAPAKLLAQIYFTDDKAKLATSLLPWYEAQEPIIMSEEGLYAAEEAFELTNNPSREEERMVRYGNQRSVSTGDIVEVDGIDYLCGSFGWITL